MYDELIVEKIKKVPTYDVSPVVCGKWNPVPCNDGDSKHVQCSVCGEYFWAYFKRFRFCPNCGANLKASPKKARCFDGEKWRDCEISGNTITLK